MRRLATWGLAAFAAFYLATQPAGAARVVHSAFNGVHQVATSLASFVNHL